MELQVKDNFDKEFINLILEIEKRYEYFTKHDKLKIESWIKKLCLVTNNIEWKKNRNLHAIAILDMILNHKLEEPYSKFADDSQLFLLSRTVIKSKLSDKFQEISFTEYENNIQVFSSTFFNLENNKSKLRENKQLLKTKVGNYNNSRNKSADFNYIHTNKYINSSTNYQANLLSNKMKHNPKTMKYANTIIENYKYENDIDNLRYLIVSLKEDIRNKDDMIYRHNEEKKMLNLRIKELEFTVEKLILSPLKNTSKNMDYLLNK